MPEEEVQAVEAAAEEQPIDVNTDKTKSVVVTLIILSIAVMVLTPVITIFAVKTFVKSPEKASELLRPQGTEINLGTFRTNIAEAKGRFVAIDISVQVSDSSIEPLFMARSAENPRGMLNLLKARIVDILSSRTEAQYTGKNTHKDLALQIKERLNQEIKDYTEKGQNVEEVYFPVFLVQ